MDGFAVGGQAGEGVGGDGLLLGVVDVVASGCAADPEVIAAGIGCGGPGKCGAAPAERAAECGRGEYCRGGGGELVVVVHPGSVDVGDEAHVDGLEISTY